MSRAELQRQIVRCAQSRVLFAFGVGFVLMTFVFLLLPIPPAVKGNLFFFLAAGGFFFASWAYGRFICPKRVKCPSCSGSLWELNNGHYKPRRIGIRLGAKECPHCGTPIV